MFHRRWANHIAKARLLCFNPRNEARKVECFSRRVV